jgi:hypothetical protein
MRRRFDFHCRELGFEQQMHPDPAFAMLTRGDLQLVLVSAVLGETYTKLRAQHLVGKIKKGCELPGPNARSASLTAPLKGSADFIMSTPRKVADISVRGGAAARTVTIGATIAKIKSAYPKAKVDHSTDHTFGITLVGIPKDGGGKPQFAVDTKPHKVILIGIPVIAFCE